MPTYEYICNDCGHEFEFFQSMKEDPLTECPSCHGHVRRKIGLGAGIIFKGSGFYETDFKDRKGTKPTEGKEFSGASEKGSSSAGSDTAKSAGDAKSSTPAAAGSGAGSGSSGSSAGSGS